MVVSANARVESQSSFLSYLSSQVRCELEKVQGQSRRVDIAGMVFDAASDAAERIGLAERVREFARRVRRAALLFVGTLLGFLLFSMAVSPMTLLLWLVAVPLVAMGSALSMMWPSRRRSKGVRHQAPSMSQLARTARHCVLETRRSMPASARQMADAVGAQLKAIESSSRGCRLDPLADIEARRLLSEHLPRLIDRYVRLSAAQRAEPGTSAQLETSLGVLSRELQSINAQIEQHHSENFHTEHRFVASKYVEAEFRRGAA